MMPVTLSMSGLPDAIQDPGESLQSVHRIHTHVRVLRQVEGFDEQKELMLYRVAQEPVTNIVKHANATRVIIQLSRYDGEMMLTVEDNGKGFDNPQNPPVPD